MKIQYRGDTPSAVSADVLKLIEEWEKQNDKGFLPFVFTVSGGKFGFNASMTNAYRNKAEDVKLLCGEYDNNALRLEYLACDAPLKIVVTTLVESEGVFRRKISVENVGGDTVVLTGLAHLLTAFSYGSRLVQSDFRLKYCNQTWYGEGQWRDVSLCDAGIFDEGVAPPMTSFEIGGTSSQTTAKFYPNLFLEDKRNGSCFFCELEADGRWQMSVGTRRNWWKEDGVLTVFAGCAEDRRIGFAYPLSAGERYESAECVYGLAAGGFCEAVKKQTKARRLARKRIPEKQLIVFNDYLNCLWSDPSEEQCLTLARAAKEVGAEAYVMDAGWFENLGVGWTKNLGVWSTASNRFPNGLAAFIRKINDMGLIAGVWFEIEVCGKAFAETLPNDWFLKDAEGRKLGNAERCFFDFTNAGAVAYLTEKICALLDMGVRYIKNDYNDSYFGAGSEGAAGTQKNLRAFYRFIDSLYEKYPDLLIENCGSGAMRSDGCALSHFALQSFSDQDDYRLYPSIVKGGLANIPPEQLGIWCTPHPVHISGFDLLRGSTQEELIVYNFVSALAGIPYLSGRIDMCSREEKGLIAQGVSVAKEMRDFVKRSHAEYPVGFSCICNRDWDAFALADDGQNEKLFYVWRLEGAPQKTFQGFSGYEIEQLYPPRKVALQTSGNELSVTLPRPYTAVLLKLTRGIK